MLVKREAASRISLPGVRRGSPDPGGRSCAWDRMEEATPPVIRPLMHTFGKESFACDPRTVIVYPIPAGYAPDSSRVYGGAHACCSHAYGQKMR